MTKNGNFCTVLQCVGTNSGWFLTEPHRVYGVLDPVGLVVYTSAFTAHRSVILGKLWFVGNFYSNIGKREHSWVWGWGIRYPCHWRERSLGSKPPSGIYSRRVVLLDHISGYVGKTLVFEK